MLECTITLCKIQTIHYNKQYCSVLQSTNVEGRSDDQSDQISEGLLYHNLYPCTFTQRMQRMYMHQYSTLCSVPHDAEVIKCNVKNLKNRVKFRDFAFSLLKGHRLPLALVLEFQDTHVDHKGLVGDRQRNTDHWSLQHNINIEMVVLGLWNGGGGGGVQVVRYQCTNTLHT